MAAAVRVLVVDDCRDCADSMSLLLEILGCNARVAYDGATAIEITQCFCPDVILLDLGMPEMDGFQVAKHMRRASSDSTLLLVAHTGYPNYREPAAEAGFDDYLLKPVNIDRLKGILEKARRNHMAQGKIKKIVQDKGFGFIQSEDHKDIFFHHSSVPEHGFDNLFEGQMVEYDIEQNGKTDKGPRAKAVMPLQR